MVEHQDVRTPETPPFQPADITTARQLFRGGLFVGDEKNPAVLRRGTQIVENPASGLIVVKITGRQDQTPCKPSLSLRETKKRDGAHPIPFHRRNPYDQIFPEPDNPVDRPDLIEALVGRIAHHVQDGVGIVLFGTVGHGLDVDPLGGEQPR